LRTRLRAVASMRPLRESTLMNKALLLAGSPVSVLFVCETSAQERAKSTRLVAIDIQLPRQSSLLETASASGTV
jgi:hypothetical protein